MADARRYVKAACLCGTFNIDIPIRESSLPLSANFCHCNRCRYGSGSLAMTYVLLEGDFSPDASALSRLTPYNSTKEITRYFCPTCGCHALWNGPEAETWYLATGCLAQLEGVVVFDKHIYIEDTRDGGFSDWITQHEGTTISRLSTGYSSKELEIGWRETAPIKPTNLSDRLHAHCDCRGVNFYIARPTPSSAETSAPWPDVLVPHNSGPPNLDANESWWLRADKQKFLAGLCTCDSCRLAHGFEFVQWAFIPTSDISLDPHGEKPFSREFGTMKAYRSSDSATRRFCNKCGASVFWDGDVRPGLIDVGAGLLDAPEGSRAESWLDWRTERVSYREDAAKRAHSLVVAVEKDLCRWGQEVQARDGPHERFTDAHEGNIVT